MLVAQKPAEPAWVPVLGAKVLFAPINRTMVLRARRVTREASQEAPDDVSALDLLDDMGDALSHALIVAGVRDWADVAQQRFREDGSPELVDDEPVFDPLPFSAENLALLLADPVTFDAFDTAYVVPFVTRARERAAPGNGSAASPNGTGEAAMPASDTVNSAAPRKKAGAAPRARTSSTKRTPRPKKPCGKSSRA